MWYYEGRIRIEPDWNVKIADIFIDCKGVTIRIEPDWNVKLFPQQALMFCLPLE